MTLSISVGITRDVPFDELLALPQSMREAVFYVLATQVYGREAADALRSVTDPKAFGNLFKATFNQVREAAADNNITVTVNVLNAPDVTSPQVKIEKVAVQSSTTPNTVHHVTMHDGRAVHCTCKGFEFRQNCKHLIAAENKQFAFRLM